MKHTTCQNEKLSEKSLLGEKMENQRIQQSNAKLSECLWWEKPTANDEAASVREDYNYFRYCDPNTRWYIASDPIGIEEKRGQVFPCHI